MPEHACDAGDVAAAVDAALAVTEALLGRVAETRQVSAGPARAAVTRVRAVVLATPPDALAGARATRVVDAALHAATAGGSMGEKRAAWGAAQHRLSAACLRLAEALVWHRSARASVAACRSVVQWLAASGAPEAEDQFDAAAPSVVRDTEAAALAVLARALPGAPDELLRDARLREVVGTFAPAEDEEGDVDEGVVAVDEPAAPGMAASEASLRRSAARLRRVLGGVSSGDALDDLD